MKRFLVFFLTLSFLSSCVVQMPKYATVDQVFALKIGMTKTEVGNMLGIPPFALKSLTDSEVVLVYKYRAEERRVLSMVTKKTNGVKTLGRFMDLDITYGCDDKVREINSKQSKEEAKIKSVIDFNTLFTFLTVTAPAALVYIGIQNKL